jgi:mRNA-degrading endonuclease RelE of RelBE toxin-antitoxin system
MSEPYAIQYADEAVTDLKALRAFDQRIVIAGIETHLTFEPRKESKSRIKAMNQPFWSQYRLRLKEFRVYYDVSDEPRLVSVLRILEKGTRQTPEQPQ